jgi:hypothetical protein
MCALIPQKYLDDKSLRDFEAQYNARLRLTIYDFTEEMLERAERRQERHPRVRARDVRVPEHAHRLEDGEADERRSPPEPQHQRPAGQRAEQPRHEADRPEQPADVREGEAEVGEERPQHANREGVAALVHDDEREHPRRMRAPPERGGDGGDRGGSSGLAPSPDSATIVSPCKGRIHERRRPSRGEKKRSTSGAPEELERPREREQRGEPDALERDPLLAQQDGERLGDYPLPRE